MAARLATAQGAYLRAATLFGVAERVRSQMRYEPAGPVRLLADTALATVRAALDPARFAEAFTAGQQLSLEEAFAAISASSSVTGAPSLLSQLLSLTARSRLRLPHANTAKSRPLLDQMRDNPEMRQAYLARSRPMPAPTSPACEMVWGMAAGG